MDKSIDKLYQKIISTAKKPPAKKEHVVKLINELESNTQTELGIKVKADNQIRRAKRKTSTWFEIIKINPYWKHYTSIGMLISSLCVIGIFLFIYLTNYADFPALIPAIFNQRTNTWSGVKKDDMLFFPIVHIIITMILVRMNLEIFKFDRRLVLVINASMIIFNLILLFEIYQIYSMLLIY